MTLQETCSAHAEHMASERLATFIADLGNCDAKALQRRIAVLFDASLSETQSATPVSATTRPMSAFVAVFGFLQQFEVHWMQVLTMYLLMLVLHWFDVSQFG